MPSCGAFMSTRGVAPTNNAFTPPFRTMLFPIAASDSRAACPACACMFVLITSAGVLKKAAGAAAAVAHPRVSRKESLSRSPSIPPLNCEYAVK
eukprot:3263428-Rhodomonas_salina.4